MGTYCYTMRKRKVNFLHWNEKQTANLYDYAYKPSYSFWNSAESNRFMGRMDAAAERAFESYEGGYVICGDLDNGIKSLEGAVVYTNVTRASWLDCNEFPGEAVGYITIKGRRAHLVRSLPWYKHQRRDGKVDDREFRSTIRDGKAVTEGRFTDDHTPIILGVTVDESGQRIQREAETDRQRDGGCTTCAG